MRHPGGSRDQLFDQLQWTWPESGQELARNQKKWSQKHAKTSAKSWSETSPKAGSKSTRNLAKNLTKKRLGNRPKTWSKTGQKVVQKLAKNRPKTTSKMIKISIPRKTRLRNITFSYWKSIKFISKFPSQVSPPLIFDIFRDPQKSIEKVGQKPAKNLPKSRPETGPKPRQK